MAVLVLLESLNPVERAVFVLREAFDYGYDEISEIVGKSEDNTRQLASRARRHVDERRPRFEPSREQREELVRRFMKALKEGETEPLVELLAADAEFYGDGGGKAPAVGRTGGGRRGRRAPAGGFSRVGRRRGATAQLAEVNGEPGHARLRRRPARGGVGVRVLRRRHPRDPRRHQPRQAGSHLEHDLAELAAGLEALVGGRDVVERVGRRDRHGEVRRRRSPAARPSPPAAWRSPSPRAAGRASWRP